MAKSRYTNCRFCPHCGVASLERDFYAQGAGGSLEPGHKETVKNGCEYLCSLCGFGFRILHSKRATLSEEMHMDARKLRNAVTFDTKCVGEDVAEAFEVSTFTMEAEPLGMEKVRESIRKFVALMKLPSTSAGRGKGDEQW